MAEVGKGKKFVVSVGVSQEFALRRLQQLVEFELYENIELK